MTDRVLLATAVTTAGIAWVLFRDAETRSGEVEEIFGILFSLSAVLCGLTALWRWALHG